MANEILWTLVNTALRSIAVLGIRKVFKSMDAVRRLCLGLLLVVGLHGLTTVLVTVLICHPIAVAWDSTLTGECGSQVVAYVVLEAVAALIDLVILIVPIPVIWRLQSDWQYNLALSMLFSVGVL